MSDNTKKPLGRQLEEAYTKLNSLIPKANKKELATIKKQRAALDKLINDRLDETLPKASKKYAAITVKLQEATTTIQNALDDIDTVANAIAAFAQVVDLLQQAVA